ncbi:hypothetical protein V1499_19195 [Neobacillus sp. SCS-31]|uniref:hypothetical protein n=1 Tax=Neobacillus oceani TaxID=3115292 RepID=UPI003906D362
MMDVKYLAGWEVDFDDEMELSKFLHVQGIDADSFLFFKDVQGAIELRIKDGIIMEAYSHDADECTFIAEDIKLPFSDWKEHKVFFLEKDRNGAHKLGAIPDELILPAHENLKTPFHYIGTLDGTDPGFSWLGMEKLHIIYPLNEFNMGIYLDYSNPGRPVLLNPETFSDDWYDGDLDNTSKVEFEEKRYRATRRIESDRFIEGDDYLLCGAPLWYQMPEIPLCPKTNQVMDFVCTINSDSEIQLLPNHASKRRLADDYLCFGDHGHLFVFYHPESKVLHLNVQF